ncbi:hypothetical protein [Demequina globuliformis]|uniref:hypothetical protein n=1 Tax=Demequina globuliformis TaxID=676202 RepID=UPI000782A3B0|nr:hypothetical protein [Demequina globuliformis]
MDWNRHKRAQGQFWLRERPRRWYWFVALPLIACVVVALAAIWFSLEDPPSWAEQAMMPLGYALFALVAASWVDMYVRAYRVTRPTEALAEESSPAP